MSTRKTSILYQTPRFYAWDAKQAIAVNEDIFSSISDYLSKERTEKTAQPYLVIGEAGSGKTYLLKRLLNAIEKDNRLALFPVLMDAKALFSSEDIWMRCAKRLNLATSSGNVFDDLISWQAHHTCRIVLFVDNIQYYFQRTDDAGHYNLRGKLNKAGAPVLIATANEVSSFFTDYKSAFFDGFKILYIRPVGEREIDSVLGQDVERGRFARLWEYVPRTIRSLLVVSGIVASSANADVDLEKLVDCFHLYYQAKYDASVIQIQRLLSVLAMADEGLALKVIREMTGQENGQISPYLKMMADQKIVERMAKNQRGAKYRVIDPLFRLWLNRNVL